MKGSISSHWNYYIRAYKGHNSSRVDRQELVAEFGVIESIEPPDWGRWQNGAKMMPF